MNEKKLIIVIIIMIIALFLSPMIFVLTYNSRMNSKINLTRIPYANHTINPETTITSDMISYMYVPKALLLGNYLLDKNEIIGKCSKNNSIIIEGSLYYSDLLKDCD